MPSPSAYRSGRTAPSRLQSNQANILIQLARQASKVTSYCNLDSISYLQALATLTRLPFSGGSPPRCSFRMPPNHQDLLQAKSAAASGSYHHLAQLSWQGEDCGMVRAGPQAPSPTSKLGAPPALGLLFLAGPQKLQAVSKGKASKCKVIIVCRDHWATCSRLS